MLINYTLFDHWNIRYNIYLGIYLYFIFNEYIIKSSEWT